MGYPLPANAGAGRPAKLHEAALGSATGLPALKLQQTQQGLMLEMARREYRPDYTLLRATKPTGKMPDMLRLG